jgi:C-terminal processing protease CtpA/Prc
MKSLIIHAVVYIILFVVLVFVPLGVLGQQAAPAPPDMAVDAATREAVINNLLKELNDGYIFPDVAKKMEADVRARQKNKEYDALGSSRDFAKKLTEDLQAISRDKHLRVRFSIDPIPVRQDRKEPTEQEKAEFAWFMKRINYGFNKIERLDGNIGLIDLRGFTDEVGGADTVAAAMAFLANTDAIIFDLRENGGGNPAMIALISSYLFGDKPVHLNDLYFREGSRTEEFWTKPERAARKFPDKDIYVLTSNYTFSGAEEFSNNLKVLKRATIIGETTGGGANPGDSVRLNEHFNVFVPVGRAVNPVTKTNWEGTGVEPDVKVPKELALKTAYVMALTKSLEKQTNPNIKNGMKALIDTTQKEIEGMKKK